MVATDSSVLSIGCSRSVQPPGHDVVTAPATSITRSRPSVGLNGPSPSVLNVIVCVVVPLRSAVPAVRLSQGCDGPPPPEAGTNRRPWGSVSGTSAALEGHRGTGVDRRRGGDTQSDAGR